MAEAASPDVVPLVRVGAPRRRLPRLDGPAAVGATVLAAIALAVLFGPLLSPYAYDQQELALLGQPAAPSLAHWLGTDELGRDALTRVLYGGRISLSVGLASALVATAVGTSIGAVAGYFGGLWDAVLMRFTDVMLSIPALPLVLVISAMTRPSPPLLVMAIAGLIWMTPARVVRAQVMSLRALDYVAAARALGAGPGRILFRHILPNSLGPIVVSATLAVAGSIMLESALSFLGFGVQPPVPTWGNLLNQAEPWLVSAPWLSVPPGLFIFASVMAVNLIGDRLRPGRR